VQTEARARVCTVVSMVRYVSQDFSAGVICALPLACFNALAAAGADLFVCQKTHETAAAQCHCQAAASRQYTGDIPVATIIDKRSRLQMTVDGEHRAMEDAFAAAPQHAAGGAGGRRQTKRRQTKQLALGRLSCVHGVPARLGDDRFREKKAPNSLHSLWHSCVTPLRATQDAKRSTLSHCRADVQTRPSSS
jgi:hypothetical protein